MHIKLLNFSNKVTKKTPTCPGLFFVVLVPLLFLRLVSAVYKLLRDFSRVLSVHLVLFRFGLASSWLATLAMSVFILLNIVFVKLVHVFLVFLRHVYLLQSSARLHTWQ